MSIDNSLQEVYNKTFDDFLQTYFYDNFKGTNEDGKTLEIIFSPYCNLGCKYCYLNKYYPHTFPKETFNPDRAINNTIKLLNMLYEKGAVPNLEIFSGELFAQESGFKLLYSILDFYKDKEHKPFKITVPSNFTFINSDTLTQRVKQVLKDFEAINIHMFLSSSVDGKYLDENNRAVTQDIDIPINLIRDEEYYEKFFKFCSETHSGLHPMVYSQGIEKWKDNFLWYQSMMKKYNIPWKYLYLLQVRNEEWSVQQNYELYKFIKFLIKWTYDRFDGDTNAYVEYIIGQNKKINTCGFNILTSCFGTKRGYSCAIQSSLAVKVNDLSVYPCHRLLYDNFKIGEYNKDTLEFNTKNLAVGLSIYGGCVQNSPVCANCNINQLCTGGCLGAQYETHNELLLPIPTVCLNELYILKGIVDGLEELHLLDKCLTYVNREKIPQFYMVKELEFDEEHKFKF